MKKSELDITILSESFKTLVECYNDYIKEQDKKMQSYIQDSCIKRFEYTYESAKKIMNKYLKKEYDKTEKELSINNIYREMYGLGFIENFENWVHYRECRNTTSHEYSQNEACIIIEIIPQFIRDVEFLIKQLGENLQ